MIYINKFLKGFLISIFLTILALSIVSALDLIEGINNGIYVTFYWSVPFKAIGISIFSIIYFWWIFVIPFSTIVGALVAISSNSFSQE